VAPDLAQEELEGVRRRLEHVGVPRRRRRLARRLLLDHDDLDVALLELAVERLDVCGLELERIDRLGQLDAVQDAYGLHALQQQLDLVVMERCGDLVSQDLGLFTASCGGSILCRAGSAAGAVPNDAVG
jgi:hypothetical protein